MKLKNLLLILPLTLTTAFSLSSCSEDSKFKTTAATNIRLENRVLKWDQGFGIEDPYTVVKIGNQEHLVYARTSLDLTNIVSTSGKLDIELISKPNYFYWMYKDVSTKASFDVEALQAPDIDALISYTNEDITILLADGDKGPSTNTSFELVINDKVQILEGKFYFTEQISDYKDGAMIKCRRLAKDETTFHSPWTSILLRKLFTPTNLVLKDNVLTWDSDNIIDNYVIYINGKFETEVQERSYEIPFGIQKGSTIQIQAAPENEHSDSFIPSELTEPIIL